MFARRPFRPPPFADPGAVLFARTRRQLTLWYMAILVCTLALFGLLLYFGVRQVLFASVDRGLTAITRQSENISHFTKEIECPPAIPLPAAPVGFEGVCFAADGTIQRVYKSGSGLPDLADTALFRRAVQNGPLFDTINGGSTFGPVRRVATPIRSEDGQTLYGVIVVGVSVRTETAALTVLLVALLIAGTVMLVAAGFGGRILANRALAPARLAFERQQTFLADAAHELRTPLTLLRADAEVLARGREHLAPDDVELLEDIIAEAGAMGNLLTTLLTVARLDAGNTLLEHDLVNLAEVAATVARRIQSYAAAQDVALSLHIPAPVHVLGDRALLEQLALILVDNAVKYNRVDGMVTVTALREGEQAVLRVQDTGIGIAADHLRHLGERFYRVDTARSRETGGAGLGLSIGREIAARHGGTLHFTSIAGEGTTATLYLRAVTVPPRPTDTITP